MHTFINFPTASSSQKTVSADLGKNLLYFALVFGVQVLAVCIKVGAPVFYSQSFCLTLQSSGMRLQRDPYRIR